MSIKGQFHIAGYEFYQCTFQMLLASKEYQGHVEVKKEIRAHFRDLFLNQAQRKTIETVIDKKVRKLISFDFNTNEPHGALEFEDKILALIKSLNTRYLETKKPLDERKTQLGYTNAKQAFKKAFYDKTSRRIVKNSIKHAFNLSEEKRKEEERKKK